MPRIPIGNFGNAMPQVDRVQMPRRNTGQLAQAIGNAGNALGGALNERQKVQDEADVQAKRIELYHNQVAEQEAKLKLDDVLTTELSEHVTLLKNDVANGALTADDAKVKLTTWSNERYKQIQGEMPMHAEHLMNAHWSDAVNKNITGFLPLQLRADAQKGSVIADRYVDLATRYDRDAGLEYLKTNLAPLNLSEAEKQERIYKYQSTRDVLTIDDRITTAVAAGDATDLEKLVTDLDGGSFGYIDGPTVQQKKAQVLSRIGAIQKQNEVKETERMQLAGKHINDFKSQVLTGRALDDEYMTNVQQLVAGTEHEAEFNFYKSQSANFQNFSRLSSAEQEKRINEQKAKARNSKTTDAVTEEKVLGVYESLYSEKKQTLKDNPNQAVREVGLQTHELKGTELKTNPSDFAKKAIENGVRQKSLKDPNLIVKPIASEDLAEAKQAFEGLGVNQKLDFIGSLINQSKGVANGDKIWGATLGQLGSGDLTYIAAGVARNNGYKSNNGEDVATAIVSGTQALKNKQLIMPNDDLLRTAFNEYVGSTVSGSTANMTYSTFKAIFAHLASRDGYLHQDEKNLGDAAPLVRSALSMATGGVYEQGVKFGNQKTWKVSKPYGMEDTVFEGNIEKSYSRIAKETGLTVAELRDLRLRRSEKRSAKGEIQYDLIDVRGKPLAVNGVMWRINIEGATK